MQKVFKCWLNVDPLKLVYNYSATNKTKMQYA
jgi:hypothetical protein